MSHLFKVFIEGMGSMVIMPPDSQETQKLDPDHYIHRSAAAALNSDWQNVGSHLINAAKKSKSSGQDKTQ